MILSKSGFKGQLFYYAKIPKIRAVYDGGLRAILNKGRGGGRRLYHGKK
jgi:hypothetical protein